MNESNSMWSWVIGIVVVVVIIAGAVWYFHKPTAMTDTSMSMSSTTDEMASTTAANTGSTDPVPVKVTNVGSETVAQIVAGLSGATEYQSIFASNNIGATLIDQGASSYTVFVSTDQGFGLLKPGTISNMTAAEKKRLVQYSIISGEAINVDSQSGSIKALSGDLLNIKIGTTGLVQVNSSYALTAYKGTNGIVYVMNQPLVPPTSGNIMTP